MGIRYEKDTILNWINEMGKFLRLLAGQSNDLEDLGTREELDKGYKEFFKCKRAYFEGLGETELIDYSKTLAQEQVRPLAQLLMYDGLINKDKNLLLKSKLLFEHNMRQTGAFSFEDYGFLKEINKYIV